MFTVEDMEGCFIVNSIPGWCAGAKLSGISDEVVPETCLFFKQITKASWKAKGNRQF